MVWAPQLIDYQPFLVATKSSRSISNSLPAEFYCLPVAEVLLIRGQVHLGLKMTMHRFL